MMLNQMKRAQLVVAAVVVVVLLAGLPSVAEHRALGRHRLRRGWLNCFGSCGKDSGKGVQKPVKPQAPAPAKSTHYSRISGSAASFTYNIYAVGDKEASQLEGSFQDGVLHVGMAMNTKPSDKPQAPGIAELGLADLALFFKAKYIEIGTANQNWDVYYYLPQVGDTGNDRFGDADVAREEWARRFGDLGHKIEPKLEYKEKDKFDGKATMSDIFFHKLDNKDEVRDIFQKHRDAFEKQNKEYTKKMDEAYRKINKH